MEIRQIVERVDCVTYDGTNGDELVEMFEAERLPDTRDGELVFRHPNGVVHAVPVGNLVLFRDNRGINDGWCDWKGTISADRAERRYRDLTADEKARDDRLAALEAEVTQLKSSSR